MSSSRAKAVAATTPTTEIEPGTAEEAYQAINRAKMLWSFRRRDVDSWQDVIDRWCHKPKAWKRIPEGNPYGSPKAMIEAELSVEYEAFNRFIEAVLGLEYVAKISGEYQDRPGPKEGTVNNSQGNNQYQKLDNRYLGNDYPVDNQQRGNNKAYLMHRLEQEFPEALPEVGKGKTYKTVKEAARKLGIIPDRKALTFYADNPIAAGKYLADRVDHDWLMEMVDAYMKAVGE